jgi:gas vesicle protein
VTDKEMQETGTQLGIAFIVGVMVGAVAMLFLAPRSGKEVRTGIHDGALHLRDQAQAERDRMHVRMDEMNAKIDEMKQQAKSIGHHDDDTAEIAEDTSNDATNLEQ